MWVNAPSGLFKVGPADLAIVANLVQLRHGSEVTGGIGVGEGSVWDIASTGGIAYTRPPSLYRINPATNSWTPLPPEDLTSVAPGAGSVWVAKAASGVVLVLDPRTGRTRDRFPIESSTKSANPLAVGPTGAWVVDSAGGNLYRIDPRTGRASHIPVPGITGVAEGLGAVWVTVSSSGTLIEENPETGSQVAISVGRPYSGGCATGGVAVGGGSVWVADTGDGTVVEVDPRAQRVVRTIRVGGRPYGIVADESGVWVTDRCTDSP